MTKTLRAPKPTTTSTVAALDFVIDPNAEKSESKNYDIIPRVANDDKQCPVLIGSNGKLYLRKGMIDPKTVVKVTLQVIVETT